MADAAGAEDEMAGPLSAHKCLSFKKVDVLVVSGCKSPTCFSPQSAEPIEKETRGWIGNQISPLEVTWRWRR